jgi:hypothetical protein
MAIDRLTHCANETPRAIYGTPDFHDFVRLLETHPEWRTELRRIVLTREDYRL